MKYQNWKKLDFNYCPDGSSHYLFNYAAVPFIGKVQDDIVRIYFSARNKQNQSSIGAIDLELTTLKIKHVYMEAFLSPGILGNFDYDGVMGCQLFEINQQTYLSYIGWNLGVSVPFRNAIGIAKLVGLKFQRIFNGPVLDRSIHDPCFVASNHIIQLDNKYLMYYLSCVKWEEKDGILTHNYHIKIAESQNGLDWYPTGKIAINFKNLNEYAISVPRVIFENGIYKMWFSYRGGSKTESYRIGYAESQDAINWHRKDELVNLDVSNEGWDSEMICYPYVFDYKNKRYMLYNGNGYGKTGFGIAILENE
jgi:hypothetical protein